METLGASFFRYVGKNKSKNPPRHFRSLRFPKDEPAINSMSACDRNIRFSRPPAMRVVEGQEPRNVHARRAHLGGSQRIVWFSLDVFSCLGHEITGFREPSSLLDGCDCLCLVQWLGFRTPPNSSMRSAKRTAQHSPAMLKSSGLRSE